MLHTILSDRCGSAKALTVNRTAQTVDVDARADLGGTVFGCWPYGSPVEGTQVVSGNVQDQGHAFVNNTTPEQLAESLRQIGQNIRAVRGAG